MHNKIIWTPEQETFIRENHERMNNQQLADALGMKVTSVRSHMYSMGIYRMRLEYWTAEQVDYLRENYRIMGDVELAEQFAARWYKEKGWGKKHMEKKRRYLKLKRTPDEIEAIQQRNVAQGRFALCPVKAWAKRGTYPDGTIRYWKSTGKKQGTPYIKVDGKYVHWARWRYEQLHGPCPEGYNVVFADRNSYHRTDENLLLISNAENAKRNAEKASAGLSDNYVLGMMTFRNKALRQEIKKQYPQLIEVKRKQLLLQRELKKAEQ
jgi:hypothetical protein